MEFAFISRLLEFWSSKTDRSERSNWRKARAKEVGDTFKEVEPASESEKKVEEKIKTDLLKSGARHLDCAPGHVQQAVEMMKKGVPFPEPPKE